MNLWDGVWSKDSNGSGGDRRQLSVEDAQSTSGSRCAKRLMSSAATGRVASRIHDRLNHKRDAFVTHAGPDAA
ncbi:hypothetical protein GCM10007919_29590 [Rhizobium indigoferae]|nr:hypothetical protein GCM10007919_29590 [Rhizobium indigoferae]